MMQVIGGISEHGYLHLNIQVDERKCYHHKIMLIGKLGSKCMNKRRNVTTCNFMIEKAFEFLRSFWLFNKIFLALLHCEIPSFRIYSNFIQTEMFIKE